MPQLPPDWNNSAAQASLALVASSPEYVIPLWWHSGGYVPRSTSSYGAPSYGLQKGSGNTAAWNSGSAVKLHTLSTNWPVTTKFAFEASVYVSSGSYVGHIGLYDITTGTTVTASQIDTSVTAMTVIRSGQFTLTPGHVYGVFIYSDSSAYTTYITDASLIVFPS